MPELPLLQTDGDGLLSATFSADVLEYSTFQFHLDRIISDIKVHLYYLPGDSIRFPRPAQPDSHQARIKGDLDVWWTTVLDTYDLQSRNERGQKHVWSTKLKIRYHTTLVLLFQPSQSIRAPSEASLLLCYHSACAILDNYQLLYDLQALNHGWRAVQNIFMAGATLVYSYWTTVAVRRNASATKMSRRLRTCSSLLSVGGEWWPSARKGLASFGCVVDLTIQRMYTSTDYAKQPRLTLEPRSTHGTSQAGNQPDFASSGSNNSDGVADSTQTWDLLHSVEPGTENVPVDVHWYPDQLTTASPSVQVDIFPEVEDFLADFNRSEFSWNFSMHDHGQDGSYDIAGSFES
jgi:hypothetical protein